MKRYDIDIATHGGEHGGIEATETESGEWVKYEDVKRFLAKKRLGDHCTCGCHETGSLCMECCDGEGLDCEHRYFSIRHETVPPIVTCVRCHEPLPICEDCFQPHGWHLMDCPAPDRERAERKKRRRLCST